MPIAPVELALMFGFGLPFVLELHRTGSQLWEWYASLWFLPYAVFFLVQIGIIFFNRPKFLVPPRFCHQPGALQEWLDAWRAKQGKR